ncbi:MAG: hypothetical protein EP338_06825 [Bacteroidetes bacterium]|nr:MAG: hypothetical protein EP338_06825 [Bacteroidota bacterium]
MYRFEKKLLFILACLLPLSIVSQIQGVAYTTVGKGVATTFVSDYHCLGINVSALGWERPYEKYKFTAGGFEANGGIYSEALTSARLRSFAKTLYGQARRTEELDWEKQRETAAQYAEKGIALDANYNWGGISFQGKLLGGIAFNVVESYSWYSRLNENLSDLVFRGKIAPYFDSLTVVFGADTSRIMNHEGISDDTLGNVVLGTISVPLKISELTRGSSIRMLWNRSYNLAYGRKVFGIGEGISLYAGLGGRIIHSMAMFQFDSDARGVRMLSSLTPSFGIDYGDVALSNPTSILNYNDHGLPPVVGNGFGVDAAVSATLMGNKVRLALALNNVGWVTYKHNLYQIRDTLVGSIGFNGIKNENVMKSLEKMLSSDGLLTLVGQEEFRLANPANVRIGASFHPFDRFSIGIDLVAPFNRDNPGSIQNFVFSSGMEVRPLKWLHISVGFLGGGLYQTNVPCGVNFVLKGGKYEFGIASRDALTFFSTESNTVSGALGIARFRF